MGQKRSSSSQYTSRGRIERLRQLRRAGREEWWVIAAAIRLAETQ